MSAVCRRLCSLRGTRNPHALGIRPLEDLRVCDAVTVGKMQKFVLHFTTAILLQSSYFWMSRSSASGEHLVSSVKLWARICRSNDACRPTVSGSCSVANHRHPAGPSMSPGLDSVLRALDSHHVTRTWKRCVLSPRSGPVSWTWSTSAQCTSHEPLHV